MLIVERKMANMSIEIYGSMIGRLVGEAKLMDSFATSEKLKRVSSLRHEKIMNLVTGRSLHLKISTALYDRYDPYYIHEHMVSV